jgi:hypothetical protein
MSELDTEVTELDERPAGEAGTDLTEAQDATDVRAADDKGEPGNVPYQRFKEVNDVNSKYRKLGKPEEVEARLARLAEIEEREAQQHREQEAAERRRANPKQADADDLIADSVRRQFPEMVTAAQRQQENERLVVESHVQRAFDGVAALLEKHNLRTDPETVKTYETLIEGQILKDDSMKADFWKPSLSSRVVEAAFGRVKAKLINPALVAAGARTLDDAASRRARTLDRAAPSGTARVKPLEFKSQYPIGSAGYDRDRAAYRDAQMDAHFDAADGEEVASL